MHFANHSTLVGTTKLAKQKNNLTKCDQKSWRGVNWHLIQRATERVVGCAAMFLEVPLRLQFSKLTMNGHNLILLLVHFGMELLHFFCQMEVSMWLLMDLLMKVAILSLTTKGQGEERNCIDLCFPWQQEYSPCSPWGLESGWRNEDSETLNDKRA